MPTPNTADAMKRHKAGKAGFTDKAHLKAKGLIPRADGTKRKSDKYKEDLAKYGVLQVLLFLLKKVIQMPRILTQGKSIQKDKHHNTKHNGTKIIQKILQMIWIDNHKIKMLKK